MASDQPLNETLFPAGDGLRLDQTAWSRRIFKAFRIATYLTVALIGAAVGGFALFATHVSGLKTPAEPPQADAIIVLTGGQARLDAAMSLLRDGKGKRLLISGVHPSATKEQLRRAVGGDETLFDCCVDIDRAALDTIGNAEESAKWVNDHGYKSVIIVTNNYHMPRSLLEMGREINGAKLEPYPVVNTNLTNGRWLLEPEALRVLTTEYAKYLLALGRDILPERVANHAVASMNDFLADE